MISTGLIKKLRGAGNVVAVIVMVLAVLIGEGLFFAYSSVRLVDHPIAALVVAVVVIFVLIGSWFDKYEPPAPQEDMETISNKYGSASFQSPASRIDAEDAEKVWSGVFLGKASSPYGSVEDGVPVFSKPENHTLIVARTRTGKGTKVICPTLLRYGLGRKGASCIVIDPKGENAAITARARRQKQYVHIMDPWGELETTYSALGFTSATYNPLDVLDRNDRNAVAIAQALAGAMCPQERGGKDGFWTESANSLLTAVLLWIADQPDETKTLARAREIVSLPRRELREKFLISMVASEAFDGAIRENAAPFLDMAPETYSGVTSNLARFTKFLSDPRIKEATASSSFSMADLTGAGQDRPTTLYVVIPPDRVDTQKTWLRLIITAGMQIFRRKPPGAKYRCLFLIDEFAALGKLDISIATMAGYGVDYALIIQNFAQLNDIYGEAKNDIISNCAYKWFCNLDDLSTAEYLSKYLGKQTIRIENTGKNKSTSTGDKSHSRTEGENVSKSETGRDLLTPDEILNLGSNTAILLAPGSHPHYLATVEYWKLPETFSSHREVAPALYWPLFFDPNPYLPAHDQARPTATLADISKPTAGQPGKSTYNPAAYSPTVPPAAPSRTPPAAPSRPINLSTYAPKGQEGATGGEGGSGSTYDPGYYSPDRIAERDAAKKKSPRDC